MSNLASASEGAVITLASSNDTNYPPEAIIDGNPSTYWSTTGMFPQQVIVSFRSLVAMDTILVRCSKIARIRIERNDVPSLENFQTAVEKDAEDTDNDLQILKFEVNISQKLTNFPFLFFYCMVNAVTMFVMYTNVLHLIVKCQL
jgi:heat shock protein beta-11